MSKFAMVFPGQGSQAVGMLADLAPHYPVVEQTFQQASRVLGYDLWDLVQNGTTEDLGKTERTQPALLAASVALFRIWQEKFPEQKPSVMAGHSLGEYSALVCAGVLDFEQAIKLVELRGQLMQQAVPAGAGAMFAIIGLENEPIINACAQAENETGEIVAAVNFNSPGQVVIAGTKVAATRAAELCKAAGAKRALPLAVSVPSHCALMKPAAEKLSAVLQKISLNPPLVSVINNVDVRVETELDAIRDALVRQLYSPVRWTETVEKMANEGITTLYEIGPNKVLTGLTSRIVKTLSAKAVNDVASFDTVEFS